MAKLKSQVGDNRPSKLARFFSNEGGLLGLPLRASNEALPKAHVARAQETNGLVSHSVETASAPIEKQ